MRHTRLLLTLPLLGLCAVMNSPAQAQPDPKAAPKTENPPNIYVREAFAEARPLTAEQLAQLRAQQAEIRAINLKSQLTRAGFTDEALQNAVVNEYKAQETAKADLLAKWRKITTAVANKNTTETDMAAMLKDFRDSLNREQARHQAVSQSLETQFQVSKKPLLDATLMTMGLTGNEAATIGQVNSGTMQFTNVLGTPILNGLANIQPLFQGGNNPFTGGAFNGGAAIGGLGDVKIFGGGGFGGPNGGGGGGFGPNGGGFGGNGGGGGGGNGGPNGGGFGGGNGGGFGGPNGGGFGGGNGGGNGDGDKTPPAKKPPVAPAA